MYTIMYLIMCVRERERMRVGVSKVRVSKVRASKVRMADFVMMREREGERGCPCDGVTHRSIILFRKNLIYIMQIDFGKCHLFLFYFKF